MHANAILVVVYAPVYFFLYFLRKASCILFRKLSFSHCFILFDLLKNNYSYRLSFHMVKSMLYDSLDFRGWSVINSNQFGVFTFFLLDKLDGYAMSLTSRCRELLPEGEEKSLLEIHFSSSQNL